MEWLAREVSEEASRRGYEIGIEGDKLILKSAGSPLRVVVAKSGDTYLVRLETSEDLGSRIEEIVSESDDPKGEVESLLDEALVIVELLVKSINGKGLKVRRLTRDAILDVYDTLESIMEG